MTDEYRRRSEGERREIAQRSRGQVVEGSGMPLEPRSVSQMLSLRLDPEVVRDLRGISKELGMSVSELLREATLAVIAKYRRRSVSVCIDRAETGFVGIKTLHALPTWPSMSPTEATIRSDESRQTATARD